MGESMRLAPGQQNTMHVMRSFAALAFKVQKPCGNAPKTAGSHHCKGPTLRPAKELATLPRFQTEMCIASISALPIPLETARLHSW